MSNINSNLFWNLRQSYLSLPESYYYLNSPESAKNPEVIYYNQGLAKELGLPLEPNPEALSGKVIYKSMTPLSQAYAGHQFGTFTMLGDGRAHLLGEISDRGGQNYDVQLKGSGRTPYSRGGDGRAGLGSVLREYMMGEAMTALGIASTRGLAVVSTGEMIQREKLQSGAILVRVARSHLRVGTFQLAAARNDLVGLSKLAEFAIQRHYPAALFEDNPYRAFLQMVCEGQGELIAKWQLVGFVHGVMNTDNMSIAGETIDYGPCAFLDNYSPGAVFSSIDELGRYAYGNQPFIGGWNLARLAEALLPLLAEDEAEAKTVAGEIIEFYYKRHLKEWRRGFGYKLGIHQVRETDDDLFSQLLNIMAAENFDYTNTFLYLTHLMAEENAVKPPQEMDAALKEWIAIWKLRLAEEAMAPVKVVELMQSHNPKKIPRNQLVDHAIRMAEEGEYSHFNKLLDAVKHPFEQLEGEDTYQIGNPSSKAHKTYCGT